MDEVDEAPLAAVRDVLRALLDPAGEELGGPGQGAAAGRNAEIGPPEVEHHGPVALVRGHGWHAWVLAVFPASTDPVLAAAAELQAQSLLSLTALPPPVPGPWDDEPMPSDPPGMTVAQLELGAARALVLVASPRPGEGRAGELTAAACELAPAVRRVLPASTSWAVAALPPASRERFDAAAHIARDALAPWVQVQHLAASLLVEADLAAALPVEGPWPDPAPGLLELLQGAAGAPVDALVLRDRVARQLAAEAGRGPAAGIAVTDPEAAGIAAADPEAAGFLQAVRAGRIPGVRLLAAAAEAAPDTGGAPLDLAVHLGRTDTQVVRLAGPTVAREAVLEGLAALAASARVPWLAGRHLLVVDPTSLTAGSEQQLLTGLTYRAPHLLLAVHHRTRLAARLVTTATGVAVPTILLTGAGDRWAGPPNGSEAVVEVGDRAGDLDPTDLLVAIADELAAHHGVTLAPGVVTAAAAAAPAPARGPERDPFRALFDDDDEAQAVAAHDPIALGRARLDYACARASLRPERRVTPQDVPVDPVRGLAGPSSTPHAVAAGYATELAEALLDQPEAVRVVAERLAIAARGLARTGPRAALLFAGPPGTGKTHTAGLVARAYYGDPDRVIRIDCGAMVERHTINTLLGAPPSYVGYDDTDRLLTTRIADAQGRCVVLFDEIEKAHPAVLDTLLGVLDTGWLTDLQQRTADAREAIFILTSNLGSELFARQPAGFHRATGDQTRDAVLAEIRGHLRPELLDRLDDVVIYRPLTGAGIEALTERHLGTLRRELAAAGYVVEVGPEVRAFLLAHVTAVGVRGLRRTIETILLRDLLGQDPGAYDARLCADDEVRWAPAQEPEPAKEPEPAQEPEPVQNRESAQESEQVQNP